MWFTCVIFGTFLPTILNLQATNINFAITTTPSTNCSCSQVLISRGRPLVTIRTENFTLTFYVPNEGHSVDEIYNADVFNDDTQYILEDEDFSYTTRCLFPEFTAEYDDNIAGIINDLGVKKFFIDGECDFSNITDAQVFCSSMVNAALGPEKKEINYDFVVDRSFAYILSYKGVPVFTGVVKNVE